MVQGALNRQAAVALLGPRRVGKTTLALAVAEGAGALYLDLESREDRAKLSDPALFLLPKGDRWAIEIKRGLTARPAKGFHLACEDLKPARRFVVYSGEARFPASTDIEAIGVLAMAKTLAQAA